MHIFFGSHRELHEKIRIIVVVLVVLGHQLNMCLLCSRYILNLHNVWWWIGRLIFFFHCSSRHRCGIIVLSRAGRVAVKIFSEWASKVCIIFLFIFFNFIFLLHAK